MGRIERQRELARRRSRRVKLKKLRLRLAKATDSNTKELIVQKVRRISPFLDLKVEAKAAK